MQQDQPQATTFERAIEDYLQGHEGSNHRAKTLEWHQIALGLMRTYLEQECEITLLERLRRPISVAGLPTCATSLVSM